MTANPNPDYPSTNTKRGRFLAGEGTLTVGQVQTWAAENDHIYDLDCCRDPTPPLMVAAVGVDTRRATAAMLGEIVRIELRRAHADFEETEDDLISDIAIKLAEALGAPPVEPMGVE